MVEQLTPMELGLVDDVNRAAQAMILRLAQTGSGKYTPEVETYQAAWNMALPGITRVSGVQLRLIEDGMYGPNTSSTLAFVVAPGPKPPRYASGMPTWYAANQSLVDALVAPRPVDPITTVSAQETEVIQSDGAVAERQVQQAKSGSMLITQNDAINPEAQPPPDPLPVEQVPDPYSTPWWKADDPGSYPMQVIDEQGCPSPRWINRHTAKVQAYKLLFEIDDCLNQAGVKQSKFSPYWPRCGENDIGCLQAKMIKAGLDPDQAMSIPLSQLQQMESALIAGQQLVYEPTVAQPMPGESGVVAEVPLQEIDFGAPEVGPVQVTPVKPDYRIVAVVAGAAALGGALWLMRKRKPRRRVA